MIGPLSDVEILNFNIKGSKSPIAGTDVDSAHLPQQQMLVSMTGGESFRVVAVFCDFIT